MSNSKKSPRIDQSRLAHSIGYALAQATVTTSRIFAERIGTPFALRPVDFSLLQLISANAGVTQKQLCEVLAIPAPQMTLIIDRLLDRSYIERERGVTDRRNQFIRLTAVGAELADATHEVSLASESLDLASLTRAESAILIEILSKVAGLRPSET